MAHETAIDRRARRDLIELTSELVEDRAWAPARMCSSELDYASLDLGCDLVRAAVGLGAAIDQRHEALAGMADQPAVEGPSVDPVAGGHVGDGGTSTSRTAPEPTD